MKKLSVLSLLFSMTFLTIAGAQEIMTEKGVEEVTEDITRYFDARMDMDYRNNTLKVLDLTKDEIIEFDPVFKEYMDRKDELVEEKMELIEDIQEELTEDDSPENEEEDMSDFIEEYWEVEIDEMELKKEFYDDLEDIIPLNKAMQYFVWEDAIQGKLERNSQMMMFPQISAIKALPAASTKKDMVQKERKRRNSRRDLRSYHSWINSRNRGMNLSHRYTSTALKKLTRAINTIKSEKGLNLVNFDNKRNIILNNAAGLRKDPMSDQHAEMASKAFKNISEMINEIAGAAKVAPNNKLTTLANSIDNNKLLLDQSSLVYEFFDEAYRYLSPMVNWK